MIDVLRGLAIIVVFFLAGTWPHQLGVPIPGGVLGLLLLFAALSSGAIKLSWVEQATALLLRHMVLLFVPLTVALIDIRKVISSQAGAILASLVVRFLAVLFVTVYNRGGDLLTWWLGPATVALAVPMYRNGLALRRWLPRLALVVLLGSMVGMATAGLTAWLLGAPLPVVMSTVPKSVTTPIAVEVSRELGGLPQITVALVICAGVLGASLGTGLLRLVGVRQDRAVGAAIGTSAHGIGTASLVHRSEMQATVSSWAMAAGGVFTSLLATLMVLLLHMRHR